MIRKNAIPRLIGIANLLNKRSFFLFGCRGTGKTSLIKANLPELPRYDLLDATTFLNLSRRPQLIGEENPDATIPVVIDEIQKLPRLLDEVHRLIEERGMRFLLTGSSARKLKRGGANLLAGRAWEARLFPLVSAELKDFDLVRYLTRGGLPAVWPLFASTLHQTNAWLRLDCNFVGAKEKILNVSEWIRLRFFRRLCLVSSKPSKYSRRNHFSPPC